MKNGKLLCMLMAFLIAGCGSNNDTSSSSLTNNSSSSLTNQSNSSSSTIDTTGWFNKGNEEDAINSPNEWIYSTDDNLKTTLAMEHEGEIYFYYEKVNNASWNSAKLFYHDNSISSGKGFSVSFSMTSSVEGKITINDKVVELSTGLSEISLELVQEENKPTLTIQFGTESDGILSENLEIVFSDFVIKKQANAKDIIQKALDANNYTITLTKGMNGYEGTSKFFENAAYFDWKNTIDDVSGNSGYAENETGVFGFSMKNGKVSPHNNYYMNENNEVVKGLYTSDYSFTYEEIDEGTGIKGLPSLHQLDLNDFDYDLKTNTKVKIKDGSSLKALTYMLDEMYSTYYYGGVAEAELTLKDNGNLEFALKTNMRDVSRFELSNIGTTEDSLIEEFIVSKNFCPASSVSTKGDPEVEAMLANIKNGNYHVNKGENGEFVINEKYSYNVTIDPETKVETINGYLKLADGVYSYVVEDNKVVLGENYTELYGNIENVKDLAGLDSGMVTYFNNASKFLKNEQEGYYEMVPDDNSHFTFSEKWFGASALNCSLITLEKGVSNITIGANLTLQDEAGYPKDPEMKYLVVYNIGTAEVEFMENYFASLEA